MFKAAVLDMDLNTEEQSISFRYKMSAPVVSAHVISVLIFVGLSMRKRGHQYSGLSRRGKFCQQALDYVLHAVRKEDGSCDSDNDSDSESVMYPDEFRKDIGSHQIATPRLI